ncbi:MAG: hypothetical protein ACOZJZ_12710 [Pseudomonadota bacterium]
MSYSFTVRAVSKSAALALVAVELAKVAEQQPAHQADHAPAMQAAEAFVGALPDDDTKDVTVTMCGSVTGVWQGLELQQLTGASVSVSAGLATRA